MAEDTHAPQRTPGYPPRLRTPTTAVVARPSASNDGQSEGGHDLEFIDLASDFWSDRQAPLKYIVAHATEGVDSRVWVTKTGRVSYTYLIREDEVYRLVSEEHAAWHAGIIVGDPTTQLYTGVNPNEESIGIAIEGKSADRFSDVAVSTFGRLVRDIWKRRGPLPLVAHYHLSPGNRSDPGIENYARMVAAAQEEELTQEYKEALQRELQEKAYAPLTELQLRYGALEERLERLENGGVPPHPHTFRVNATTDTSA